MKELNVLDPVQNEINDAVTRYPLRRRILSALTTLGIFLIVSTRWRFDWAKIIALSAFTAARLFNLRGRWSIFLHGIGIGDLLLYVLSSINVSHL
jgi:hypothetical protein